MKNNNKELEETTRQIRNLLRQTIAGTSRLHHASKLLADIYESEMYKQSYSNFDDYLMFDLTFHPVNKELLLQLHKKLTPEETKKFTLPELIFLMKIKDEELMKKIVLDITSN